MKTDPIVLGIETSCDETGVGIVRGSSLLSNAIASSVDEHARFGGVVPEVASRAHVDALIPMVQQACRDAALSLRDIDAVAVTAGPGLAGSLLVGVAGAKALAVGLDVPIFGVNHLAAHIAVDTLQHGPLPEAVVGLLVSGGHSSLLRIASGQPESLGSTLDDAAGEAFDKVARLLGLPFPGGPWIDRMASTGNASAVDFPRGVMTDEHGYNFSFSGVKTAVARFLEASPDASVPDVAASFQEAVVDVLTAKAVRACRDSGIDTLIIGGGVAANSRLRDLAEQRCSIAGITLRIPRPELCTDNGAMVAALGAQLMESRVAPSSLSFPVKPSLPISQGFVAIE